MNRLSPIALFTFHRLGTLIKTVNALKANFQALDSDLIIFSDGARNSKDEQKIIEIRSYLKTINGFKSVTIHESITNIGLAKSIITGVSWVLKKYPTVIVLEDDLIPSTNFLSYMNQALTYYQDNTKVLSISGFSPIIYGLEINDIYFTKRSSSWGWACWADRWSIIDWQCDYYDAFRKNRKLKSKFNEMGSDMTLMLKKQMEGNINSWAIRFCFHQFQYNLFSVHPAVSKIQNIGISDELATNTYMKYNRFSSKIDDSGNESFFFTSQVFLSSKIIKQFVKDNTLASRIFYKILNLLN